VEELLEATGASRATLRLDASDAVFLVVAEALAPGVRSIRDDDSIDIRRAATFRFLERELRPLVQNDCLGGEHPAPKELVDFYGVRAQMLGPIVRDGRLVGIVSVHDAAGPRQWGEQETAALNDAVKRVGVELERAGWKA
jgi:maleate isomerase